MEAGAPPRTPMHEFSPTRYDSMPYRKCGRWGLKLPAVSLGTWETFGGYRGEEIARECLFRAFDLGVTHFDFANNYGRPAGNAEAVAGKVLREMPRDELIVATKAGYTMWPGPYGDKGSRKYLVASIDQSLRRLGLEYVDIFYHHRPDPDTPIEETMGALDQIVRSGKALYAGVSNYSGEQTRAAVAETRRTQGAPIVIHQPHYNMLARGIEKDLAPAARELGFGIIAFSPLANGLLSDKYLDGIPADSRAATNFHSGLNLKKKLTDAELVGKIRALNGLASARGQTLAQMSLAWLLRLPEVTSALIGASRVSQIEENITALKNLHFSPEELAAIDRITG